ncbi:MAG: hypothetical protein KGI50_01215 [Patescibacteria group bacterium]|nr:hypothetical protein [Patescibacteria group bacterium]MDE2438031.1 hypothetical protein [Patescibacteria group bacterium]
MLTGAGDVAVLAIVGYLLLFALAYVYHTIVSQHTEEVERYLKYVRHEVWLRQCEDEAVGRDFGWRQSAFWAINQKKMVSKWWKKPEDCIPDKRFYEQKSS